MKFSLHLADYYSDLDLKSLDHDEIVHRIGAQLGAVEEVIDWAPKYKGVVLAEIISCEKHPNADKLSVCMVDDGGVTADVARNNNGHVQVVCGAPNVKAGLIVAWIPPGATVPSSPANDPFVLEARELRGEISNGMLASPKELDMSDEHDGILEVTTESAGKEPKPGQPLSDYYGLNDFVVDCENKMFTHRPDCFGNLGIARELAGIFGMKYESPEWYRNVPKFGSVNDIELSVSNDVSDSVPRFMVVAMQGVSVGPSPAWMQGFLKRAGIKPISNIVDITNYVMHLTGQPLHAFDYDKLQKVSGTPSLFPRMAKKGEKLTLLGEKVIELNENDMVIATDKQAVALAGVMGGAETEVDSATQNIVIECANFDMYAIRRTSMRHGLFTDAVTRFNKGQSPLQNDRVLDYTLKLMASYAGATQASDVYDLTSFDMKADNLNHVDTTASFINERLGSDLPVDTIKKLLENVEFTVAVQGQSLHITAPFWRMDISIGEDIVEEVGRLYGYDKLPVVLPLRSSKPTPKNAFRTFKQSLRGKLVSSGANEVLTYSFVHGKLLENTGTNPDETAYHLRNALSPDLQYYRTSLMPSLLAKVRSNIKAQAGSTSNEFALFEIGKAHVKDCTDEHGLPIEFRRLSLVVAADAKTAHKYDGSPFYHAKKYLDLLLNSKAVYEPLDTNEHPITASYQIGRSAMVMLEGKVLGVIGEFHSKAKKALKLPDYSAGFELDLELLQQRLTGDGYQQLSTFPSSSQDITFEVSSDTAWDQLMILVRAELAVAHAESGYTTTVEPVDIFSPEKSNKNRVSLRFTMSHNQKTLKTEEVSALMDTIAKAAHEKLQAVRI